MKVGLQQYECLALHHFTRIKPIHYIHLLQLVHYNSWQESASMIHFECQLKVYHCHFFQLQNLKLPFGNQNGLFIHYNIQHGIHSCGLCGPHSIIYSAIF